MPETLPSYFIGHGNPMNAVLTNTYTERWTRVGRETPRPKAVLAVSAGMLLSVSALLLEEMSLHLYRRRGELATLCAVALLENLGYRQLTALWRLQGLWQWAIGAQVRWGTMTRTSNWQKDGRP